jgi:hypothetical protein
MIDRRDSKIQLAVLVACALALVASLLVTALAAPAVTAPKKSHVGDCTARTGIARARCERHERMYAKCGPIKGEAHFVCDREFLLAYPLDCSQVGFADAQTCEAERAAFIKCEPQQGRAFIRCVRTEIDASPMGH